MVCVYTLTYNHAPYITDAMTGFVAQQTNFPYVCTILDDASTDGEQDVIKHFVDSNFDLTENGGYRKEETDDYNMVLARNKGNKNCYFAVFYLKYNHHQLKKPKFPYNCEFSNNSNYIAYCEGDDYWTDPFKLQKQVDYMQGHPKCSLVFHNAEIKKENTGTIIGNHRICNTSSIIPLYKIVRDGGLIPSPSILYRTDSFKDFKAFPSNCPVGDLRIQTYAAMVGDVYYMNVDMAVYRRVSTSMTHKIAADTSRFVAHHKKFIEWYKSVNEYTDYKYDKDIKGAIAFSEARIAIAEGNYYRLWRPKYYPFINNETINTRIGLLLRMMGMTIIYEKVHAFLDYRRNKK